MATDCTGQTVSTPSHERALQGHPHVRRRARTPIAVASWHAQIMSRADSDEAYVLDLCDEILDTEGSRQHRFDWLRGDPGANDRRATLPVDAYWSEHRLVVEYNERQHREAVAHFDKPYRLTVSGVHRGEQRARYDELRQTLIPAKGLRLIVIESDVLAVDGQGRLRRHRNDDLAAIRHKLTPALLLQPAAVLSEAQVLAAFGAWLIGEGWETVEPTNRWTDIEAVREDQRLIGEAKGHTTGPGLDEDTGYGQLLRRMTTDSTTTRYALIVPTRALQAAQRVPPRNPTPAPHRPVRGCRRRDRRSPHNLTENPSDLLQYNRIRASDHSGQVIEEPMGLSRQQLPLKQQ